MPNKNSLPLHPKMKVSIDTIQQLQSFSSRGGGEIESEFVYLPVLYIDGKLTLLAGTTAQTNIRKARAIAHAHAKELRRRIRGSRLTK